MPNSVIAASAPVTLARKDKIRKEEDPAMLAQYPTLFSDLKTSLSVAWSLAAWHVGARLPVEWRWNASAHFECEEDV